MDNAANHALWKLNVQKHVRRQKKKRAKNRLCNTLKNKLFRWTTVFSKFNMEDSPYSKKKLMV